MAEAEVRMSFESTNALVEQLGKTFDELESHRDLSSHKSQWKDIKDHFRSLERSLMERVCKLEKKENAFKEKQSEKQVLLTEREAAVVAKEHASLERLQEAKDIAVSAIIEARKNCKVEVHEPVNIRGSNDKKISTTTNGDPNSSVPAPEGNSTDNRSAVPADAEPRLQLKQLCEKMDAKGLVNFISQDQKHQFSLRKELSIALKSASEPARLLLDCLEGFYHPDQPTSEGKEKDASLQALHRSCLVLLETVAPLLGMTQAGSDNPASSEIKQQAKAIADQWKPKLASMDLDVSNGNSSEAQVFLQLLATYGIASEFDEDELAKFVLAVSHRKQAPDLCSSLGLTQKVPGIVEALVNCGRQLDAVSFAYAFSLTESFPPVPLLKAFLNDKRKSSLETSEETGGAGQDASSQELSALRAVVRYIEDGKLQDAYPLAPLQKRVAELKKATMTKGELEASKSKAKRPRLNPKFGRREPGKTVDGRQHQQIIGHREQHPQINFDDIGLHGGALDRYAYAVPPTSYAQHTNVQRGYYYTDERDHPPAAHVAPSYGSYMHSSLQTATANNGNYASSGYQSVPSNYSSYGAADVQSSRQSVPSNYTSYRGADLLSSRQSVPSNYTSYGGADLQSSRQPYM